MKIRITILCIKIIIGCLITSCQNNQPYIERSNTVFFLNVYNSIEWREVLEQRKVEDSLLNNKLTNLSVIIGNFARNAIDKTGGFNPQNGTLMNPSSKIKINEDDLDLFYTQLHKTIHEIGTYDKYNEVYKELNEIFDYNFFSLDGSLSRSNIINSNIEIVSTKLLLFENICYLLIIKYT